MDEEGWLSAKAMFSLVNLFVSANVDTYMMQVDISLFEVEPVRVLGDTRDRVCLVKSKKDENVDGRNENGDWNCPIGQDVHCGL